MRPSCAVGVTTRLSGLHPKDDEDDPANYRQQIQKYPPAASIGVMQTPDAHGDARKKRRERESPGQVVADALTHERDYDGEQYPPPELRPRCAAIENHVFLETNTYRVDKGHIP